MVRDKALREGEVVVDTPKANDAGLVFIGRIRTPWTSREDTPRQGRHDGPVCRLEIFEPWVPALKGVDFYNNLEVIYWLHQSRRDLVLQSPKDNRSTRGTFSLRSPVRPNPIGTSIVKLVKLEGNTVFVRGMDCLDETPLIDIKPDRCEFSPLAAGKMEDGEAGRERGSVPVARMERSEIRGRYFRSYPKFPDFASLHPGYETTSAPPSASPRSLPAPCRLPFCSRPATAARLRGGA